MPSMISNELRPAAQLEILKDIIKQGGRVYLSLAGHEQIAQVKIDNGEYKLTTSHRELNPPYCSERKKIMFSITGEFVSGTKIESSTQLQGGGKYATISEKSDLSSASAEVRDTLLNLKRLMNESTSRVHNEWGGLNFPQAS